MLGLDDVGARAPKEVELGVGESWVEEVGAGEESKVEEPFVEFEAAKGSNKACTSGELHCTDELAPL